MEMNECSTSYVNICNIWSSIWSFTNMQEFKEFDKTNVYGFEQMCHGWISFDFLTIMF